MLQCKENLEFSCDNGKCINIKFLCDGEVDCSNGEDEEKCRRVTKHDSYNSKEPPTRKEVENWETEVSIQVNITSISHVEEINQRMTTRFQLHLYWRDHRLTFHNLKDDNMQNIIIGKKASNMWIPPLVIESAEDPDQKNLDYDKHTTISVRKESDPDPGKVETLHETLNYTGADNSLALVRNYDLVQLCNFQLDYYPFDHQNCFINVRSIT